MNQTEIRRINKKLDELSTDVFTILEFKRSATKQLNEAQRTTNPDDVARAIKDTVILSDAVATTVLTLNGTERYLDHAISTLAVVRDLLDQGANK